MSEIATCLTKSGVLGLTPSTELTPVFSPTDCASAGPASSRHAITMIERFMVASSTGRLAVDALAQRHGVELGVGGFFLVQVGGQEPDNIVVSEFFRPGDQGAVTGDFIMLHGLRVGHDRGVEHRFVVDLARGLV